VKLSWFLVLCLALVSLAGCGQKFDLKNPTTQSQIVGGVAVGVGAYALYTVSQKPAAPYIPPTTTTLTPTTTRRGLETTTTTTLDPSVSTTSTSTTTTTLGPPWDLVTASASFPSREGHAAVVFAGKMWLIGGVNSARTPNVYYRDVWESTDGVTWTNATTEANFAARESFACVAANLGSGDRIWLLGGNDATNSYGDVWSSADGINWECATSEAQFGVRDGHAALFYDNKLWVIAGEDTVGGGVGGLKSDVWYSSNGTVWTQEASATSFGTRYRHGTAVFNSRIWLVGGWNGSSDLRDAWSSSNGLNWTAAALAPFNGREGFGLVSSGAKLWVVGGAGYAYFQDSWSTTDGTNWTRQTNNVFNGKPRNRLATLYYNGKLWALGGYDGTVYNDVWSYTP
jgi:hypothetical protein